jgi:hypothetical protein
MSGHVVDGARWVVDFAVAPTEGHAVAISVPTDDKDLIAYSPKLAAHGVFLDGSREDGYTATFTCLVKRVRHMLDVSAETVPAMVVAIPENRGSEQTMMYLLDRKRCDSAFLKALQKMAKD